jgi:hypothetical protein
VRSELTVPSHTDAASAMGESHVRAVFAARAFLARNGVL